MRRGIVKRIMRAKRNSKNGFERWLERLGVSRDEAALLLGKSVRAIRLYQSAKIVPPRDTRMLMTVMTDGVRPKPWPQ